MQNRYIIPVALTKRWYFNIYLTTNYWRWRRRRYLNSHVWCERCSINRATECHHISYERLYCETNEDLMALCRDCHVQMHTWPKPANDNDPQFDLFEYLRKKSKVSA